MNGKCRDSTDSKLFNFHVANSVTIAYWRGVFRYGSAIIPVVLAFPVVPAFLSFRLTSHSGHNSVVLITETKMNLRLRKFLKISEGSVRNQLTDGGRGGSMLGVTLNLCWNFRTTYGGTE
jgi:hypothetical protein